MVMLQRIQSLFLLVSVVLLGFLISAPFATFYVGAQMKEYYLKSLGLYSVNPHGFEMVQNFWFLFAFFIVLLGICIVTIFLFNKRMLQIRLTIISIVMLVGVQGVMYFMVHSIGKNLNAKPHYSIVFILPLVAAVLNFLALRAIARDEALIRSLNRLR